jgi:queuine tRNA-ribosyltransferase
MAEIRHAILNDTFHSYYLGARDRLAATDSDGADIPKPFTLPTKGNFCVVKNESFYAIKQISSGEIMHSVNNPMLEANSLYIEQSKIIERALANPTQKIIVWDVGLGGAFFSMALVLAYEKASEGVKAIAPLEIYSFEKDLDAFKLTLKNTKYFPHVRHPAPHGLAEVGYWKSKKINLHWKLYTGDFLETYSQAPNPDFVFYDPFSYKSDGELWQVDFFQKLFSHWEKSSVTLLTYSSSTAVRATLLKVGFYVAKGIATGPKSDTTIALTKAALQGGKFELLGADWLQKWERSDAKVPVYAQSQNIEWITAIRNHSQFIKVNSLH